ncbi:MAG: DNA-directed RNA polymerase subunit beta', partial [Clostridiales Family XIII bacterium]|nr:DNA-directed RNA polymerase subunit beta' [Clostridiales Family XIII bacterium]
LKPEKDGLFCEKIFGPMKDWECHCGKYKRIRYKGIICDRCGVEVTKAKVRRERMGHIDLAAPVSHIWYFKGIPSRIGLVLDISPRNLEKVMYFAAYIVLDKGDTELAYKEILTEQQYRDFKEKYGDRFRATMGAEAVRELLTHIDLDELAAEMRAKLKESTGQKKVRIVRRLEVIEALRLSGNRAEWMILEAIPVIPPDLRPMVQLDGGRFATSDLNDLYRRVINRNNRLIRLLTLNAPDIIVRNEKRMLQEAVDALIDNGRHGRPVTGPGSRPLKSLSDMLKGKQGRFRQNLLGKRVDYSGRSVIVVGPELKFYQCGLPKRMALELFKPFIMKELVGNGAAHNIKIAKRMVDKVMPEVWDVLDMVIKEHPVLLNRAPTLHRLGIQAFEPVLVEGKAIRLHPLVCTAYNADFDGDQMAVHVPLTVEAQAEARFLMLSVNNILAPKDGSPITTPTQDMILGSYYLTHAGIEVNVPDDAAAEPKGKASNRKDKNEPFNRLKTGTKAGVTLWQNPEYTGADGKIPFTAYEAEKGDGKVFTDFDEMLMAYREGAVNIHAKVFVRRFADDQDTRGRLIDSTVGRFIFNENIPQDLGFVDRGDSYDDSYDPYSLEVNFFCDKKGLGRIIDRCYRKHRNTDTAIMLDHVKELGFHYSTLAAVTISVSDMEIPGEKEDIIKEANGRVEKYDDAYQKGIMTEQERYDGVVRTWTKATDDVADALMGSLGKLNNLYIMAHSGARGSKNQIRQISGMRGLMATATGKTIEIPIKANFREGLSVLEYFISTNGARKGLADTALRTAESGYLTRRLVDVSHNVIVREDDCGTDEGIIVSDFHQGKEVIEKLKQRIIGRTALIDIVDEATGEVIVEQNEEITEEAADRIEAAGIEKVAIRSVLTCHSSTGICTKCYGRNMATGEIVNIGEAVGIQAAQSIGEPGTQLTMRTFHTGGVAGGDITQGLPRVEELFEARKPKSPAEICREDGVVEAIDMHVEGRREIRIVGEGPEPQIYAIPFDRRVIVEAGDFIEAGEALTSGALYPKDILKYKSGEDGSNEDAGVAAVYQYLLKEVQRVYKLQGVDINDKHIEIIVSQMLSKYRIDDPGDTNLLSGNLYSKHEIEEENAKLSSAETPAKFRRELLGITKASLATNSFLSAASFQETTKVLTDAAIRGRRDNLLGLKENVIIGKLIPAGTGMKRYKNISVDYGVNAEFMEAYQKQLEARDEDTDDDDIMDIGGMKSVEDGSIDDDMIVNDAAEGLDGELRE